MIDDANSDNNNGQNIAATFSIHKVFAFLHLRGLRIVRWAVSVLILNLIYLYTGYARMTVTFSNRLF